MKLIWHNYLVLSLGNCIQETPWSNSVDSYVTQAADKGIKATRVQALELEVLTGLISSFPSLIDLQCTLSLSLSLSTTRPFYANLWFV